jgi:phytol kinase
VAILSAIVLALCVVRYLVIGLNPDPANWNGPMWSVTIASLALATVVPSLVPQAFAQARVLKLTLLSLAIPLATYLYSIDYSGIFT